MYVMQKLKQNVLAKTRRVVSVNQLLVENALLERKLNPSVHINPVYGLPVLADGAD